MLYNTSEFAIRERRQQLQYSRGGWFSLVENMYQAKRRVRKGYVSVASVCTELKMERVMES